MQERTNSRTSPRAANTIATFAYAAILLFLLSAPGGVRGFEVADPGSLRQDVHDVACSMGALLCVPGDDTPPADGGDQGGGGESGDGTDVAPDPDTGTPPEQGTGGRGSDTIVVAVRTEEGVVARETLTLPRRTAPRVSIAPTDGGAAVAVDARSALALLHTLDARSNAFEITDLRYYPAYGAFYLACITIADEGPRCGSWQFAVNGTLPTVGLDTYLLGASDHLTLFFGEARRVRAPEVAYVGVPFTLSAERYDAERGTYVPLGGYIVGIVVDNPNDPWSPLERAAVTSDAYGAASFTLTKPGTYRAGLREDGYLYTASFTVEEPHPSAGGTLAVHPTQDAFSVPEALAFLVRVQKEDGSFGAPLYTDWAALALGAAREATTTALVRAYLTTHSDSLTRASDHERRAMALMALGVDPRTGTSRDLIGAIRGYFDGANLGESPMNNEVFALVTLYAAGYGTEDPLMCRLITYVVGAQDPSGGWGGVDMTAAALQALAPFRAYPGVPEALSKGEAYLRAAQATDGGFGNSFSTSWALQAIAALGQDQATWLKNGRTPLAYLGGLQRADGGLEAASSSEQTRVWATAYAIPAALGMPWSAVLGRASTTVGAVRAPHRYDERATYVRSEPLRVPATPAAPVAAPVVRAAVEGAPVEDHIASSVATTTAPSPAAPRMALAMRVLAALCTGMLLCFLGLALYPRGR